MKGTSKPANTDLAIVFGGGGKAAPGPSPMKAAMSEAEGMGDDEAAEGEEEAPPAEFGVHVREAFPELGDDQVAALYRAIKSCGSY